MTNFDRIKKMLNGSTTMPQGAAGGNVHYHNGVACTHDHSHDHGHEVHVHDENCNHDHAHEQGHETHHHHKDGSCCDHGDDCDK